VARKIKLAMATAVLLACSGAPAAAQNYSESYKFLKAVKDRDGEKAESSLAGDGLRNINTREYGSGDGALHILARERDITWLRFILTKGARPDLQNKEGETPLILAAQLGWYEGANSLLKRGAKVDLPNGRGETPLIVAVHNRDVPMIRLLLASGADPKRADRIAGYSALDYAKQDARSAAIVKILEEAKPAKQAAGPKL
jgi:ankyrin repeat protein